MKIYRKEREEREGVSMVSLRSSRPWRCLFSHQAADVLMGVKAEVETVLAGN